MPASMGDLAARMDQRKQRLQEEQQQLDRKQNRYAQNPDGISEPSELESSQQAPKPKRRHHRSSTKSPFDDDSSIQFSPHDKKSNSTTTTSSSTPRQPNKFVKKPTTTTTTAIPVTTSKLSVTQSPRDVSSPRLSTKQQSGKKAAPLSSSTGLLAQSALLARAAHRQQLHAKGIELEPGVFDQANEEDDTSSEATSTSGAKILFGSGKKTFVKKTATTATNNQVPDLQHLDSETNSSGTERKKSTHKKNTRPSSVLDTEDDSSLDFIGDGSSSEGRKTPTLTPRKGILKSPKDFVPKESEHSVQFSEKLFTVRTDEERLPSSRLITPRRVQIAKNISGHKDDEIVSSETESISTAIDAVDDDDDIPLNEHISESPVENMFNNLVMNNEPLVTSVVKKKSPRRISPRTTSKKTSSSSTKSHYIHRTVSDISEDEHTKVEDIPEEISIINYSEDFSSGPTETSTPRTPTPTNIRIEKQPQTTRTVSTDDRQVQVDLMSAPFQSSLNQVHSIYLINQTDLNEARPSSLIRSVIEPNVLQSLLTTNPVLLAVDDLIREQSSLLRSFIQLQRNYYESTIRSIRPEHIYTTKDNSLQFIADHQRSRMQFQSNDDSISN